MRIKGHDQKRIAPWQRLGDLDGLVIDGVAYRVLSSDRTGQHLYESSRPTVKIFLDHYAWEKIRKEPGFQHHRGMHDPNRPDILGLAGVNFFTDIPSVEVSCMRWLEDLIIDLERRYRNGETTLDTIEVQALIDGEMGKLARERLKVRQLGAGALGKRFFGMLDIKASALLDKRRKYLKHGFAALRDGRYRSGNREPRLQPEVAALIALHVAAAVAEPSASSQSILDDIRDDIEERNGKTALDAAASPDDHAFNSKDILRVPDIKTIRDARRDIDPFTADIGKLGLDAAVQLNPAVRGKTDHLGPLDRIEYDESIVDAITLLCESGVWNFLTDAEKQLVKKVRMVIGVAICVATRCIVGMRIYKVGSGDETVSTFRMIFEDKSKYIPADLRPLLSWHQYGGVGGVVMDQGSSNISDEARTVLANLDIPILVAQAARPDQRGTGERIFRTFGSEIYRFLDARTGSNIIDRRKYRPESRASLTVDELWKVLVLGVVGVYHNTPHRELNGRTPADEWERLVPIYGVNALPDQNRHRVSFGRHSSKNATRYGVAFAGLSYTNPLIDHFSLHGRGKIEVAGDPEDLSSVSVRFPGNPAWYEAPCTDKEMRGVRLEDWYAVCAAQKDLASADARKRRAARRAAKKAIRAIQENARNRADIPPPVITAEMIEQGERRIFGKYVHAEEDQEVNDGQLGTAVQPDNDAPTAGENELGDFKDNPSTSPSGTAAGRARRELPPNGR